MKIAIFSDTFPPQVNGVASTAHKFAETLAGLGHKVQIYTVTGRENGGPKKERAGWPFEVIELPSLPFWGYSGERFGVPFGFSLNAIRKFKPDIIHSHTPFAVGWEAVLASKLMEVPLVGTHHTFLDHYLRHVHLDNERVRQYSWKYSIFYYNVCDLITSPSNALAENLRANKLKRDVHFLSNPVDTLFFKPPLASQKIAARKKFGLGGKVLVYMGRLSYEKNIGQLFRIFETALKKNKNLSLLVVGDGPERQNLTDLAAKLGIIDKVIFTGFLRGPELRSALYAGDIFVTASKSENMPISILEAMATGLPVVGADALGIPDVVADGENGHLLPPDDIKTCANIINKLATNQALLKKMSASARKTALKNSAPAVAKDLLKIYERAIKKNK